MMTFTSDAGYARQLAATVIPCAMDFHFWQAYGSQEYVQGPDGSWSHVWVVLATLCDKCGRTPIEALDQAMIKP